MRQVYTLFALTIFLSQAVAQSEVATNVEQLFVSHFNNGDYTKIHELFSSELKESLPQGDIITMFEGLKLGVGSILSSEYKITDQADFNHFKTTFEKAILDVSLSTNDDQEITGLTITPYVEEDILRNVVNQLDTVDNILSKKQKALIFQLCKEFPPNTELALGIIKNNEVHYYGIKIEGDTMITIDNYQDLFEIGSISKVFTATILANQVISGNLDLKGKVNDCFAYPINDDVQLTYLELANHTSGLARLPSNLDLDSVDANNPYKDYDEETFAQYISQDINPIDSLIDTYNYSNLGAGLLGFGLCNKLNRSYESLLRTLILDKYGMNSTSTIKGNLTNRLVKGLNQQGSVTSNWDMSALVGAGGILSTVEDLSKFAFAHFKSTHLELELTTQASFKVDDKMSIGLGWHLIKSDSGHDWLWHNGGTGGYTSSLAMNKKSKNAIIILSNVSAMSPKMIYIDKLCFELLEAIEH